MHPAATRCPAGMAACACALAALLLAAAAWLVHAVRAVPGGAKKSAWVRAGQNAVREDLADVHSRLLEKHEEA